MKNIILKLSFATILGLIPLVSFAQFNFTPLGTLLGAGMPCYPNQGCTGNSTVPVFGQILVGNANGTYTLTATSSLGITGSGTVTSITATSPLTGGVITTSGSIGCPTASGSQSGCLASSDWSIFNNKGSGTVTTLTAGTNVTLSSGATCTTFCTINSSAGGVGTSTNPFMATYFVATSTNTASVFAYASTTGFTNSGSASTTNLNVSRQLIIEGGGQNQGDLIWTGGGGTSGADCYFNAGHDSVGGELQCASQANIDIQAGNNSQHSHRIQLGAANPNYEGVLFQYNGNASGAIRAMTIASGGSGYLAGDSLTVASGNSDMTFTLSASNITGGAITSIPKTADQFINGQGTNYWVTNSVSLLPMGAQVSHGTGATVNITDIWTSRPSKKVDWSATYFNGTNNIGNNMAMQYDLADGCTAVSSATTSTCTGNEEFRIGFSDAQFGSPAANLSFGPEVFKLTKTILKAPSFTASSTLASQLPYASTTEITSTLASTTNLITGTRLAVLKADSTGTVGNAVNGTDYSLISALTCSAGNHISAITAAGVGTCSADSGGGGTYNFPLTGNATSTLTQFNGGLTAFASSTIGNGGVAGLTINGNATTTSNEYIAGNLGVGTPSPGSKLEVTGGIVAKTTSGQPYLQAKGASGSFPGVYVALNSDTFSRIGFELNASDQGSIFFAAGSTDKDVNFSRLSAGKLGLGNGAPGDFTGALALGSLTAYASSTIGSGTAATGLTINGTATTTGFYANNGGIISDPITGTTTINQLQIGLLNLDTNAGVVTALDLPITSAAANNTVESYTFNLMGSSTLSIFGQADGAGFVKKGTLAVGIGTTSPYASLSVQSNSSTGDAFAVASSSGALIGGYDNDGHKFTSGYLPTITGGATNGTVVGDDQGGTITTGTLISSVTLNFAKVYKQTPYCTVSDSSTASVADISSISTTAVSFGLSAALTGGNLYYQCGYHK